VQELASPVREATAGYLTWCKRQGKSPRTLVKYGHFLALFGDWAGNRPVEEITAFEIDGYLGEWYDAQEVEHGRPLSTATLRNHHQALNSFYTYLERFDLVPSNPMRKLEAPKRTTKTVKPWLRVEELDNLMGACLNPREAIVIWFLANAGLRWGECEALLQKDVDLGEGLITVNSSKTQAGLRRVPIFPDLTPQIRRWFNYLEERGLRDPNLPFFCTRMRKPMVEQQAFKITRRVSERAGTCPVNPHMLRRSFGSTLINQGVRLEVVSKLLGHSNTKVTEDYYAQLLDETITQEVLEAVS
jgi:integrase